MSGQGRNVRFESDPRSRASPPRSRDSGIGSSTEYVHVGGRSDRIFTAQDIRVQRNDVGALQEALDAANTHFRTERQKNCELDAKLAGAHKAQREVARELEAVREDNSNLSTENSSLRARNQALENENFELRQLATGSAASDSYVMSGGSGESSDGIHKSKSHRHSRHESQEMKEQMKERINRGFSEAESSTPRLSRKDSVKKSGHRRSESKARTPYIEEAPTVKNKGPPVTTRGFEQVYYTTAPPGSPSVASSSTPRSFAPFPVGGDYYPEALPPKPKSSKHSSSKHHNR